MKPTASFKTNIKCPACVAKVKPALDQLVGQDNWHVDLSSPERKLTLENTDKGIRDVNAAIQPIGYKAEE